jgi:hypothetical protein
MQTTGSVTTVLGISLALLILVLAVIAGIWYLVAARKQRTGSYSVDVDIETGPEGRRTAFTNEEPFDAISGSQSCDTDLGEQGFEEAVYPTF